MRKTQRSVAIIGFVALMLAFYTPVMALNSPSRSPSEMRQLKTEARAGNVSAMLALADAYYYGRAPGFTYDRALAAYWYGEAAKAGNAEAETRLGDIYNDREAALYNEATARAWYRSAAGKGNLSAQRSLAALWENPVSVSPDYVQAYHWYVKAAEQGDEYVYEILDGVYVYGTSVKSYDEAFDRLAREAANGDAEAEWRLGKSYMRGDARQDIATGLQWLEKSADQGSAKGLYYLGAELIMGNNIQRDEARGLQMEKRAADMGYVPAQLYWAHNYPAEGDKADEATEKLILRWWLAAAEKDYSEAQASLSYYYANGQYVAQDGAEAWKWHLLSFRSPWRQLSWQKDHFPGQAGISDADKMEGRRRADAWLTAHPGPFWPRQQ